VCLFLRICQHAPSSSALSSATDPARTVQSTVNALKSKLAFHCGTTPSAMQLQLRDPKGSPIADLTDDLKKFGFYSPENGFILHIRDLDPSSASAGGWLEDTSKVEKYVMSDAEYSKRENTYRKYKEEKLAADPTWTIEREMAEKRGVPYVPPAAKEKVDDPDFQADEASRIEVGCRCQVSPGEKRGEVKFVGKIAGLPLGWWVGVQFDEPVGKNDGSVKGVRIFDCPMSYGTFVRPDNVEVGDFPELDVLGSDDEI
jgi:tubulin-specific chaperone B